MKDKDIIVAFNHILTSEETMIRKVHEGLTDKRKVKGVTKFRWAAIVCLGTIVLSLAAVASPKIIIVAQEIFSSFRTVISGDSEVVNESEYLKLKNTKVSRADAKYSSLTEVEDVLGIKLLKSKMAYQDAKNLISYTPYVETDKIYGAMLINQQYALGDLNVRRVYDNTDSIEATPQIEFEAGEKYRSALACEIKFRSNNQPSDLENNMELDYLGTKFDLPNDTNIIEYKLKKLDATALIFEQELYNSTIDSQPVLLDEDGKVMEYLDGYMYDEDGNAIKSFDEKGNELVLPATGAVLVYEGVEYYYYARVSVETMQEFLDTLSF
jgi:hypothetical protein